MTVSTKEPPSLQIKALLIVEFISLGQSYARRVINAAHDGRVIAGREPQEDRGLTIVGRREAGRLDLR